MFSYDFSSNEISLKSKSSSKSEFNYVIEIMTHMISRTNNLIHYAPFYKVSVLVFFFVLT